MGESLSDGKHTLFLYVCLIFLGYAFLWGYPFGRLEQYKWIRLSLFQKINHYWCTDALLNYCLTNTYLCWLIRLVNIPSAINDLLRYFPFLWQCGTRVFLVKLSKPSVLICTVIDCKWCGSAFSVYFCLVCSNCMQLRQTGVSYIMLWLLVTCSLVDVDFVSVPLYIAAVSVIASWSIYHVE